MKKLLVILFLYPLLSIAQNINGFIFSKKTILPIENTNVFAVSNKAETITDKDICA